MHAIKHVIYDVIALHRGRMGKSSWCNDGFSGVGSEALLLLLFAGVLLYIYFPYAFSLLFSYLCSPITYLAI